MHTKSESKNLKGKIALKTDIVERIRTGVWIQLAQDRVLKRSVNSVMNLGVPLKAGNFVTH
jgi:hypothetical protein